LNNQSLPGHNPFKKKGIIVFQVEKYYLFTTMLPGRDLYALKKRLGVLQGRNLVTFLKSDKTLLRRKGFNDTDLRKAD
jgi:hypothetical protein